MGRVNDWLRKTRIQFLYWWQYFRKGKVKKVQLEGLVYWIMFGLLYSADIWILKIFRILK